MCIRDSLRTVYGNDANFICGYEAGCLGYTLYHQLTEHDVNCVILAPTTMLEQRSKKRIKTDKRDAEIDVYKRQVLFQPSQAILYSKGGFSNNG